MFPLQNGLKYGDNLSPLLSNFALKHASEKVQGIHMGKMSNVTCKLLVYADNVNILGDNVNIMDTQEP
jgi:hypothetical protein